MDRPEPAPELDRDRVTWRTAHLWQVQAIRDILIVLAIFGLIWLGYKMRSVTTPLLVALGLAYLFEPVVAAMSRRLRMSRALAVTIVICAVGLTTVVGLVITVPLVIGQTLDLVHDMRTGRYARAAAQIDDMLPDGLRPEYRRATEWVGLVPDWTTAGHASDEGHTGQESPDAAPDTAPAPTSPESVEVAAAPTPVGGSDAVTEQPTSTGEEPGSASDGDREEDAALADSGARENPAMDPATAAREHSVVSEERIRRIVAEELALQQAAPAGGLALPWVSILRRATDTVFGLFGFVVQIGLLAFLIPFYFFFFSVAYPRVLAFADRLIPTQSHDEIVDLVKKMDGAVAGFVRGRIVICIILGILLAIGWQVCGVPYAIVLGLVVGAFNLVPYLSGVGWPVAVALLFFDQMAQPADARMSWLWIIAGPSIVFLVVQFLDGYVLTPIISGKATNLDAVTIVVAILAGGAIGGLFGMLLAVPVAACAKILLNEVVMPRVHAWVEGKAVDPLPIRRN